MRLVLMHLVDDPFGNDAEEEAAIVIPGGEKVALFVPVEALDHVAPILLDALEGAPEQRCACCEAPIAIPGPWDGTDDLAVPLA